MNTPRTDAIDTYQPFTVSSEKCKQLAALSRQLETELTEMREALEMLNNEFKRLPHSLGYRYTHTGKVDYILEKTK